MSELIGREKEKNQLEKVLGSKKSEFVAVYGRRRVGKTFLIREFFQYQFDFQLTALANATTEQQLVNFHSTLQKLFPEKYQTIPNNWFEAFQRLIDYLENLKKKEKIIVFLDELPWFDTLGSDFMMSLEHFWNSWATNRKDIILIGCGSAASWMINELINNHGGLHNRVTERIKVFPFDLKETELMLKSRNNALDRYQILQLYMVMGGIPFYLDAVSPEKSATQNIEALCFQKGALLFSEFQNLFASLFKSPQKYETVIEALSSKNCGMTRQELVKTTGIQSGGTITKILEELEESGFILKYPAFNKKTREMVFQLCDFYCSFYFQFIKNKAHFDESIWINAIDNPAIRAWSGFAFEQVCWSHIPQIKKALGVGGVLTQTSTWRSKESEQGSQIDLVMERRDHVINLFEIKFSINTFKISKAYSENLRNKIGTFKEETKTRKAVFLTMITTFGLANNEYRYLAQNEVTMDDLFG